MQQTPKPVQEPLETLSQLLAEMIIEQIPTSDIENIALGLSKDAEKSEDDD